VVAEPDGMQLMLKVDREVVELEAIVLLVMDLLLSKDLH
tara:strand:+ start:699 stop:815 length:117 start_codon:yes stop_codon:yes gene_type:complete